MQVLAASLTWQKQSISNSVHHSRIVPPFDREVPVFLLSKVSTGPADSGNSNVAKLCSRSVGAKPVHIPSEVDKH